MSCPEPESRRAPRVRCRYNRVSRALAVLLLWSIDAQKFGDTMRAYEIFAVGKVMMRH
jgi:hypothetical protein